MITNDNENYRREMLGIYARYAHETLLRRQFPSYGVEFVVTSNLMDVTGRYVYMHLDGNTRDAVPGRVIAQMVANSPDFARIAAENDRKLNERRDTYPLDVAFKQLNDHGRPRRHADATQDAPEEGENND